MTTQKRTTCTTQKAIQVIATEDPKQDQAIHKVVKRGFSRGDRPLRPEEVIIHRHTTKKNTKEK